MAHVATSETLQYLQSLFPRAFLITALDAGELLGYARKTTYNKLSEGTFPLSTTREGGKRLVALHEVARYLDEIGMGIPATENVDPDSTAEVDLSKPHHIMGAVLGDRHGSC